MELTNSKRLLFTASYVTTQFKPEEQRKNEEKPGGGLMKAHLFQSLDLQPNDIDLLRRKIEQTRSIQKEGESVLLLNVAETLAGNKYQLSTLRLAATLAPMPFSSIMNFFDLVTSIKEISDASKMHLFLNKQRRKISPIGRLHLERIEMYPAGIQKGELVFTVPMAPGETITISHKEWSSSSSEYEEIVQDYFESYSERGVAEKADSATSSESEAKHASSVNFGASLTGSYMGVTLTTTLGITDTSEEKESVKNSMQKTREVTEKASARTRKEHKVSVKIETKKGTEDTSGKTITNTASTPIRLDYFRMMRKWRTDLLRYGLRQTYDIAIPLPGVRLWALHERITELEQKIRLPFVFTLKAEDLHNGNWMARAIEFGASAGAVPPPPDELILKSPSTIIDWIPEDQSGIMRYGKIDFEVPEGYQLSNGQATANLSIWPTWGFQWLNGNTTGSLSTHIIHGDLAELVGRSGTMSLTYAYRGVSFASLTVLLTFGRKLSHLQTWQHIAWTAIKASAEAQYARYITRLQQEHDELWRLLNGKDTLSLRRLEREELVRLVMQWLLGPEYALVSAAPAGVTPAGQGTVKTLLDNERNFMNNPTDPSGPSYNPTFSGMKENTWMQAVEYGEFVKFVHQAVEWENLLYFLYPYFWGSEKVGHDKLLFEHSDPEHERFLRAGYARIVLPVRPGFEEDFTHLIETGMLANNASAPYINIAQDIANFAKTNYAGIPPANPELHARPLLFPEQRATWEIMQAAMKEIDKFKVDTGEYPVRLDELPLGEPVDIWGNPFVYKMPGLGADYDLISLGADHEIGGEGLDADISSAAGASLVATWFDYTPTSALDIEVDSKPELIA